MSYVIDHAINIPATTQRVWAVINDVSTNPIWQADCELVSFLTSKHNGLGTRWRYSDAAGHETVCEITAWYEGLGYEYKVIDGTPYQGKNRGRIRLQEIAEGTVVQWTFNYELGGVLSGVRNIGIKRGLEQVITDSLRNLYSYIKTSQQEFEAANIKSLMRDAPSVEERSQYKPRHPSALEQKAMQDGAPSGQPKPSQTAITADVYTPEEADASFRRPIAEPPVAEDDTRPNPSVTPLVEEESLQAAPVEEPSFLSGLPDWAQPKQETQHHQRFEPPQVATEASTEGLAETPAPPTVEVEISAPLSPTPPEAQPADVASPATVSPEELTQPITPEEAAKPTQEVLPAAEALPVAKALPAMPDPDPHDTAKMSVFELFGLQKPSETQEVRVLTNLDLRSSQELRTLKTSETAKIGRIGLRNVMRMRRVKVRRPKL